MKTYTLTITADEQGVVYRALSKALFNAKQLHSIGTIGAPESISQIEAAMKIMNRQPEGGFESDDERDAAYMAETAAYCAIHGSH
jgi:hypothetical protein